MQEQPHYKITPEQAWAGMKVILDKEMPTGKRSKRFLMLWASAAAILVAALTGVMVWNHQQAQTAGTIASTNVPEKIQLPPAETENTHAKPDASIVTNDNSQHSPAQKTIQAVTPESKKLIDIQNNNTLLNTPEVANSLTEAKDQEMQSIDVVAGNVPSPVDFSDPFSSDVVSSSGTVPQSIDALPLSITDVQYENSFAMAQIEPIIPKKKRNFSPHLSAGIMDGLFEGVGAHGGIGIDYHLTQALSLTGGIDAAVYQPGKTLLKRNYQQNADVLRSDLFDEGIDLYLPAESIANNSATEISTFIEAIIQWQAHAGVKLKVSPKFFGEAGMMVGFGTLTRSAYPIVAFDYTNPTSGNFFSVSNSFKRNELVKSTMASVYAGVGYRSGNHVELFAHWTQGLESYLSDHQAEYSSGHSDPQYISGIHVGMRYHL